jgi:transposase
MVKRGHRFTGPKHQEKRSMDYFAGLDVSVKDTSVCIVDDTDIAQMMRIGLYRPVHVKTLRSQKLRMLLTHRKLLQSKAIAIENDLRGTLRNFGLKVGIGGWTRFEARIEELVEDVPDLAVLIEPLLVVRRVLREQIAVLHRRLLAVVRDDEVCRRLMTIPGVGQWSR